MDRASPSAKQVTQGKVVFDEMDSVVQELLVTEKWERPQRRSGNQCVVFRFETGNRQETADKLDVKN